MVNAILVLKVIMEINVRISATVTAWMDALRPMVFAKAVPMAN